jgi:hypothetical protein
VDEIYVGPVSRWQSIKAGLRIAVLPHRRSGLYKNSGMVGVFLDEQVNFFNWVNSSIEEAIREHFGSAE